MKQFFRVVSLLAFLFAGVTAQASQTYDFAYTFNDGAKVTGSFDGDANGNLITNLSHISASIDGVAFVNSGNLDGVSITCCWATTGAAVVSIDGLQNNFIFSDQADPITNTPTNQLVSTIWFTQSNSIDNTFDHGADNVSWAATHWSVTAQVAAVPEPGTYAMLLAGLGLLSFVSRRNKGRVS